MTTTETAGRPFDVIVWGASGFTGKLTAEYLLKQYGLGGSLKWAIAGRNQNKLEAVRKDIGETTGVSSDELPILIGDADDEASLADLAGKTRVVCSTAGPYALYGSKLVAACVAAGTDYCDLTGEVQWMARMIKAHHEQAQKTGARIVFTSGFDCIPCDIGTYLINKEMLRRHNVPCGQVKFRVKGFSGGGSGGTIASMINMMEEMAADPSIADVMNDPYALNPEGERDGPDKPEPTSPIYDSDAGQWVAPFVMGAIDTKVVRRSNALLNYTYGKDFRYDEGMLCGAGPAGFAKAAGIAFGTAVPQTLMRFSGLRNMIAKRVPQPGEGPDLEKRQNGYYDIRLLGKHPDNPDANLTMRILGDMDPGYGSTSKMLGESAVCLALDEPTTGGGCLTPASALGDALAARLQANAGVTFTIEG